MVIDRERKCARYLLVAGELVLTDSLALGRGGMALTMPAGVKVVRARGLPYQLVDLSRSQLYAA